MRGGRGKRGRKGKKGNEKGCGARLSRGTSMSDEDEPAPSPSATVVARRASREAKSMREESGCDEDTSSDEADKPKSRMPGKRSRCKDGGGKRRLCEHGRERYRCKDWRISSATLVTCVKYASVCVSPGKRNSHGRRSARGRGPH